MSWWEQGLRFRCLGCGRCCRGEPGAIFFTPQEEVLVARHLKISLLELRRKYVTLRWGSPSFRERKNGACVFLNGSQCVIYPVRPSQCRSFPFWPELLASREAWEERARHCPGMNEGPLLTPPEVEAWIKRAENWL